jgi:hypothetical protein
VYFYEIGTEVLNFIQENFTLSRGREVHHSFKRNKKKQSKFINSTFKPVYLNIPQTESQTVFPSGCGFGSDRRRSI